MALVAVVIHGLIDVPYFKNDLSLEFWILLALTWAGTKWPAVDGRAEGTAARMPVRST